MSLVKGLAGCGLGAALLCALPLPAPAAQLLSITNLDLAENEFVASLQIKTWDVKILSVCHLPPGWIVSAGQNSSSDGQLSGSGDMVSAFLDKAHLGELDGLVLVKAKEKPSLKTQRTATSEIPATFDGTYSVGKYGDEDVKLTEHKLTSDQYRFEPGNRCPAIEDAN